MPRNKELNFHNYFKIIKIVIIKWKIKMLTYNYKSMISINNKTYLKVNYLIIKFFKIRAAMKIQIALILMIKNIVKNT